MVLAFGHKDVRELLLFAHLAFFFFLSKLFFLFRSIFLRHFHARFIELMYPLCDDLECVGVDDLLLFSIFKVKFVNLFMEGIFRIFPMPFRSFFITGLNKASQLN